MSDHTPTFGPYVALELLGRGGMGEVWRGVARFPGGETRPVALKFILSEYADDPKFRWRFQNEALLGWDLTARHPHLVTTRALTTWPDGRLVLVTDLVDGPSLSAVAGQLRDDWSLLGYLTSQVLSALEFVHSSGAVHRDISPGNVLLGRDGVAYVADLGLAKFTDVTSDGVAMGAIPYVAPEVLAGGAASSAADLYALGAVVYEAVTGDPPHGRAIAEINTALRRGHRPPLDRQLPPHIRALLRGLLARNPSRRLAAGRAAALLAGTYDAQECAGRVRTLADTWLASRSVKTVVDSCDPSFREADTGWSTECSSSSATIAVEPPRALSRRPRSELAHDHDRRFRRLGYGMLASALLTSVTLGFVVLLATGVIGHSSSTATVAGESTTPVARTEAVSIAAPVVRRATADPHVLPPVPSAAEPVPSAGEHSVVDGTPTVERTPRTNKTADVDRKPHLTRGSDDTGADEKLRVAVQRAWVEPGGQRALDIVLTNRTDVPVLLKDDVWIIGDRGLLPVTIVDATTTRPIEALEPGGHLQLRLWLPVKFSENSGIVRARAGDELTAAPVYWR